MERKNILILNENPEEVHLLQEICDSEGTLFTAQDLKKAILILESGDVHLLVVDESLANYPTLRGLLKRYTSTIITGKEEDRLKEISKEWPLTRYVDFHLISFQEREKQHLLRIVKNALEHSSLVLEVEKLRNRLERTEMEIKDAYLEIKEIKKAISESIIRELEKRIELEARYILFKREKHKLEEILKNIYTANDVTTLLDIVNDIKEIVRATSISFYLLEENETIGKYLKPLVWDNAFLSHPDFSKHIVLIDSQDFAASSAKYGQEINISDLAYDRRLSKRYVEQLKTSLKNILCVPIMHAHEVIGVLEVFNKKSNRRDVKEGFSKEDQQIMRTLSEHISLAITKLNLIHYDALTGLLRPEPFFEKVIQKLKQENKRREERASYAMVMGDVDWFKNYNDRNGHEAGNRLLRELAKVLKTSIREEDLLCRYGGEEFLFFLSGIKDVGEAYNFTERIRKNVEDYYFENEEFQPRKNLTMSFGITYFTQERFESSEKISKLEIKRIANEADIALAEAKGKRAPFDQISGRKEMSLEKNRTCIYQKKLQSREKNKMTLKLEEIIQERRMFPRYNLSTIIIYRVKGSNKVSKTIDISAGGVRISAEKELPLNETLSLILILNNKPFEMKADVVYNLLTGDEFFRYHSGLRFRDLKPETRWALSTYLESLEKGKTEIHQN